MWFSYNRKMNMVHGIYNQNGWRVLSLPDEANIFVDQLSYTS